jgi:hypothetical protein
MAHRRPLIPSPVIRSASTPPRRHRLPRRRHPPCRIPRHYRRRLRGNSRRGIGTRPPRATLRGAALTITTPSPPPPATVRPRRQRRTPPEVLSPQPAGNTPRGLRPTTPPPPGHDRAPPTQSTTAITPNDTQVFRHQLRIEAWGATPSCQHLIGARRHTFTPGTGRTVTVPAIRYAPRWGTVGITAPLSVKWIFRPPQWWPALPAHSR